MAYTSDEIQAVVEKLVLSTIRRPYDTLGVRRTDVSFNDVQQAAAGVFVLYPNSPFYVLALGTKRLNDLITAEASTLDALIAAIKAVGRDVVPIADVSMLFNAKAALQELGSASRDKSFTDVTTIPAYLRFSANVDVFLGGPGQTVKEGGDIVQTPQEARGGIPGLLTQVRQAHETLVARVGSISGGVDDYARVNLPSVVAQSVLQNSASLVGSDAAALDSLTPTDRLALIRQTVLNLLSVKAAVQTFGSFTGPSDFYTLAGLGRTYSDLQHEATPATVVGDKGGSFSIISGVSDTLGMTVDGGAPFNVLLNPSTVAELDGVADDSGFVIGDGVSPATIPATPAPNNNKFKVKVDATPYVATLTLSGPATPAVLTGTGNTTTAGWYGAGGALDGATFQVVVDGVVTYAVTFVAPANVGALLAQLNAVINPGGGVHNAIATNVSNRLVLTSVNTGTPATLYIGLGTANATLGFTSGQTSRGASPTRTADQVAADIQAVLPAGVVAEGFYSPLKFSGPMDVPAGVDTTWTLTGGPVSDLVALGVKPGDTVRVLSGANAGFFPITAVTPTTITVTGVTVAQLAAPLEIGPVNRRLRLRCTNPAVQVPAETKLTIYSDDTPSKNALVTLGFVDGSFSQCLQTTPDVVSKDINSKANTFATSTTIVPFFGLTGLLCRSDILNTSQVTFAQGSLVGSTSFAGPVLTFTVTADHSSSPLYVNRVPMLRLGDVIVLRDGPNVNAYYTITSVNGFVVGGPFPAAGAVIVATGVVAGTPAVGVTAEVGPNIGAFKYQVVTLSADPATGSTLPGANGGNYFVSGPGTTPIDVLLSRSLSISRVGAGGVIMGGDVGSMFLRFSSKNKTTASELVLGGTAAPLFFTSTPWTQLGTSAWFSLPSIPRGLQPGDVLELYDVNYTVPSRSFVIGQVSAGLKVIQVGQDSTGSFVQNGTDWQFSPQPVPFARLRYGTKNNFSQVKSRLDGWLANSVNQPLFFENLNRLINPLLANKNPTTAQIGSAINELNQLYAFLVAAQAIALGQPAAQALDDIVKGFTVEAVPPVDTLIKSFVEKGSNRAVDVLLSGAFSAFFSLTADQVSYAGAFQSSLREVALNDLPIRRYNRPEAQSSRLLAQSESPDFEFTAASVDESIPGPSVSPPADFGEPSSFGKK